MNKATLDRVGQLLKSKKPEEEFNFLIKLQKEQAPWLSNQEATDCVMFSLVRCYNDYKLSYLWWEEEASAQFTQQAA